MDRELKISPAFKNKLYSLNFFSKGCYRDDVDKNWTEIIKKIDSSCLISTLKQHNYYWIGKKLHRKQTSYFLLEERKDTISPVIYMDKSIKNYPYDLLHSYILYIFNVKDTKITSIANIIESQFLNNQYKENLSIQKKRHIYYNRK
ncbi:MAG: hypothetical protein ACK5MD_05845 [Flavobacteriales bacterium]